MSLYQVEDFDQAAEMAAADCELAALTGRRRGLLW